MTLLVPSLLHGELRQVKKAVAKLVRNARELSQIVEALEANLVRADRLSGMFVLETIGNGLPREESHYWCDLLVLELERQKLDYADALAALRKWFFPLLDTGWGGLTLQSQDANGIINSRESCSAMARWLLDNAEAIDTIADRFFFRGAPDGGRISFWKAPKTLSRALGVLGATNEQLLACDGIDDFRALASKALAKG